MARKSTEEQIQDFYQNIYNDLERKTLDDPFGGYVLGRIKTGQKTTYNKSLIELRKFNMEFLDVIESCYPALLKIMKDPKKSIRYEQEIVAVEKAKKVTAETVRHLSSHTHLIKEITNVGDVIPAKVLNTFAEEELAIYENRFIKSLVKRIEVFLQRRYETMKQSIESFEQHRLNIENDFLMSGQEVHVGIDISFKTTYNENLEATKAQYERLVYMKDQIQALKGNPFMKALAKAKDVFPPIMKTNIILHNPDFQMCYNLWLYLDRTDGIAFGIDVKEKNYRYTSVLNTDMNEIMSLAITAFLRSRQLDDITATKLKEVMKEAKPIPNKEIDQTPTLNPSYTKLEDYRMNEFMLNETAKFYEASYTGLQRTGSKEAESLRVVYKQMLDMLDQIYPRVFQVSDEDLNSKDLHTRLDYARRKLQVFKIVQKQKQMNIARMGKSQKKIEAEIADLQKKIKLEEARNAAKLKRQKAKELRMNNEARLKAIEEDKKRISALLKQKQNEKK